MFHADPDRYGPKQALVAENNALARILLASLLIKRGFEVTEAANGEEALAHLRGGVFDLAVLDAALPGITGIDLCRIAREELALVDLPLIACSARRDIQELSHVRMAGFNDLLLKPVDGAALDHALDTVFANS